MFSCNRVVALKSLITAVISTICRQTVKVPKTGTWVAKCLLVAKNNGENFYEDPFYVADHGFSVKHGS